MSEAPVALITGAAQRIGASIASHLHQQGYRILLHYHQSAQAADTLCAHFNAQRADSAAGVAADLSRLDAVQRLASDSVQRWGRLDLLVNNASSFYPTPVGGITEAEWDSLMGSNLKGPLFLTQACAPALRIQRGSIVNLVDIYAQRPLRKHTVYSVAKAGLLMLTRSLALELAPEIRVNGIAPGAILWPEQEGEFSIAEQAQLEKRVPLKRRGEPEDIAETVLFLARSHYITGQIIAVDGGRSVVM